VQADTHTVRTLLVITLYLLANAFCKDLAESMVSIVRTDSLKESRQYILCVYWNAVVLFITQVTGKELQFSGYLHRAVGAVRTGE